MSSSVRTHGVECAGYSGIEFTVNVEEVSQAEAMPVLVAGLVGEHQRPGVGPDLVDFGVRQAGLVARPSVTASYSRPSIEAGFPEAEHQLLLPSDVKCQI